MSRHDLIVVGLLLLRHAYAQSHSFICLVLSLLFQVSIYYKPDLIPHFHLTFTPFQTFRPYHNIRSFQEPISDLNLVQIYWTAAGSRVWIQVFLYLPSLYIYCKASMMHFPQEPMSKSRLCLPRSKRADGQEHFSKKSQGGGLQREQTLQLTHLIGYERLLSTLHKETPLVEKWTAKNCTPINDRFIPNRKLIAANYDRKENECQDQNEEEVDPQNISISEIFCEEILGGRGRGSEEELLPFKNTNILRYVQRRSLRQEGELHNPFRLSKNSHYSRVRKVNKLPCKVLDAPALQDDFYLNLIDWSATNQLAVGLGNCIYLWDADSSKVTKLCELNNATVTSVAWTVDGLVLAIGCSKGEVQLWDITEMKEIRRLNGHETRVGSMAWNSTILATGSRDKTVLLRDARVRREFFGRLLQHNQEICGLKWSLDEQMLASGGNDNKIGVWSAGGQLLNRFTDHRAAVKALAWSPHQHGLLASGGGTADRMMKMRNVLTGELLCEKDTGSQICNLAFSRSTHELVSTHGYSQNQINIWSYPRPKKVATLVGHSHRVLYLSMSPDGGTIVTGAGDQTLRFWSIFPNNERQKQQDGCGMREQLHLR